MLYDDNQNGDKTLTPELDYAVNPKITFYQKSFCFIGMFKDHERKDFEAFVERKGAGFTSGVSKETDYVVVGSKGIKCCSFACCTGVVEKTAELNAKGASIQFITEDDFLEVFSK